MCLAACCTKQQCNGFDEIFEVKLVNFTESETDSIALEIFDRVTTNRIDSSFTSAYVRGSEGQDQFLYLNERIDLAHMYKITMLSLGLSYTVSNFSVQKESCNCPADKYNVLKSYSVNGQMQFSSELTIIK